MHLRYYILQNGNILHIKVNDHFYIYVLDIIDTKTYKFKQIASKKTHKHIWFVELDNKALEVIRLPKIFDHSDIIKTLANNLQKKESMTTVTYKLGNTIRKNILKYKDVVNSVYNDQKVSFSSDLRDCEKSTNITTSQTYPNTRFQNNRKKAYKAFNQESKF